MDLSGSPEQSRDRRDRGAGSRDVPSIQRLNQIRAALARGPTPADDVQSFKRGGRVHRTGIYKLHRGERVIPARQRRSRR